MRNPAGLDEIESDLVSIVHVSGRMATDAWDAFDFFDGSEDDFSRFLDGDSATEVPVGFEQELQSLIGEEVSAHVSIVPYEVVRPGFALSVFVNTTKTFVVREARPDSLLVDHRHETGLGLQVAGGRIAGRFAGGLFSLGTDVQLVASQRLDVALYESEQVGAYLDGGQRTFIHEVTNPTFDFSGSMGAQWRSQRRFAGGYAVRLGLRAEDIVGASGYRDRAMTARGGVALVSSRPFLPWIGVDVGSFRNDYGGIETGIGTSLTWNVGPLAVGGGLRPGAKALAASLDFFKFELAYGVEQRDSILGSSHAQITEHLFGVGIGVGTGRGRTLLERQQGRQP